MEDDKTLKIYSQLDMDNITEKVKANAVKNMVSMEDFKKVSDELTKLKGDVSRNNVLKEFIKDGGMESRFDDLLKVRPDLVNSSGEELTNAFKDLKENKPYFFGLDRVETQTNDKKIFGELTNLSKDKELVAGTIYFEDQNNYLSKIMRKK